MLEQRIMKCLGPLWLRVSAALLIAVGCSLNPRPEDPGLDRGNDIPGDLGSPSHSAADASITSPPGSGGTSNQGGSGGGFTSGGGAAANPPNAATDGAADQADSAAGPSEAGADALDGGADASDAARGDGG